MTTLQKLIQEIKNLTPIPAVANQILTVADTPGCSMEDMANVIQYDPIITAGVLKTCNSAFFGLKHPAESIKDAVNMLGMDKIVELALVKSGSQMLSGRQEGYGMDEGDMWRYSICSAMIAKQIAAALNLNHKSMVFTSALLKDMGKVLLEKYVASAAQKIKGMVETERKSFGEAEKEVLGIDHAELGAMIAKMWHFSPRMVNIIRHHHLTDERQMGDKEISAVYLSDCICMMMGQGVGADGLSYRFKNEVMEQLGITANDVTMIIADFTMNMDEVERLLNLK